MATLNHENNRMRLLLPVKLALIVYNESFAYVDVQKISNEKICKYENLRFELISV